MFKYLVSSRAYLTTMTSFSVAARTSFFVFFDGGGPAGLLAIVAAINGCIRERTYATPHWITAGAWHRQYGQISKYRSTIKYLTRISLLTGHVCVAISRTRLQKFRELDLSGGDWRVYLVSDNTIICIPRAEYVAAFINLARLCQLHVTKPVQQVSNAMLHGSVISVILLLTKYSLQSVNEKTTQTRHQ